MESESTSSARADLSRFLSACFYEPTADFAEERVFDSILSVATAIDPGLAEPARRLGAAFAAENLQDLRIDYTRLFLGPVRALALPYGSVWLGGDAALMQDSTLAVRALYEQGGFDIGEEFADLPDHVAVELEFLYLLLFAQCEAVRRGNKDDLIAAQSLQREFLGEHLGAWIGAFAATVNTHAETAFYRELAGLTERFVRMEAKA